MKSDMDLYKELRGVECHCGKRKHSMQTFCGKCYHSLPHGMRQRLYDRIGSGYAEAHANAIAFLDERAGRLPAAVEAIKQSIDRA